VNFLAKNCQNVCSDLQIDPEKCGSVLRSFTGVNERFIANARFEENLSGKVHCPVGNTTEVWYDANGKRFSIAGIKSSSRLFTAAVRRAL
jgi:hypothetical protein